MNFVAKITFISTLLFTVGAYCFHQCIQQKIRNPQDIPIMKQWTLFFEQVKSIGFVMDAQRMNSNFFCFRRKVRDHMQIFSISFRKRNFSVEFTEIPLADLVVGWRRFSPEEIFPGNIYTGYGKLFMQEKKGSDFKNDENGIHVFKEKFQEILNWFETKEQGDNLILVPARDLPPIPVFENIECQIKKNRVFEDFICHFIRIIFSLLDNWNFFQFNTAIS